eukprot:SAG31_NODE_515_length_14710_cov_6.289097_9_plen_57_part_00
MSVLGSPLRDGESRETTTAYPRAPFVTAKANATRGINAGNPASLNSQCANVVDHAM